MLSKWTKNTKRIERLKKDPRTNHKLRSSDAISRAQSGIPASLQPATTTAQAIARIQPATSITQSITHIPDIPTTQPAPDGPPQSQLDRPPQRGPDEPPQSQPDGLPQRASDSLPQLQPEGVAQRQPVLDVLPQLQPTPGGQLVMPALQPGVPASQPISNVQQAVAIV